MDQHRRESVREVQIRDSVDRCLRIIALPGHDPVLPVQNQPAERQTAGYTERQCYYYE